MFSGQFWKKFKTSFLQNISRRPDTYLKLHFYLPKNLFLFTLMEAL